MSVVTHLADQQTQTSRTWLTVGIIVTVIVLAVGIFFGYRVLSGSGAASTDTTSNTYTQPITALNVRAESGTLSLSPGSGNQTTVAAKSIWDKQQPTVTQQWDGTTLTVVTSCPGEGKCEVDLTITLPAAVRSTARRASCCSLTASGPYIGPHSGRRAMPVSTSCRATHFTTPQ